MFNKALFPVLMLTVLASAPRGAAAFDFLTPGEPLKFTEVNVPKAQAPAVAAPKLCKPFLLSISVGGVDETVILERACAPDNAPVWAIVVQTGGPRPVSVKVSSENYPADRAKLESRIKSMVVDGISQADADFIVTKTGPALKLAATAAPAEQARLLADAAEALKSQLARP